MISSSDASNALSATEILRAARINTLSNEAELNAQLRGSGKVVPFQISLSNGVVAYAFQNPSETILLDLANEGNLRIKRASGETNLTGAQLRQKVHDTNLTYEDLAMRYLYWPIAKLIGTDVVRTRPAYKVEVHPGQRGFEFGAARLWIDKESGALLRIEGYDWNGKLAKRFEVISVQRIEGQWFLKSMRIEQLEPFRGKVIDRIYLEVLPPKKGQ